MEYVIISGLGFWTGSHFSTEYPDAEIYNTFQAAHKQAKKVLKSQEKILPIMHDGENLTIVENYGLDSEKPVCMLAV